MSLDVFSDKFATVFFNGPLKQFNKSLYSVDLEKNLHGAQKYVGFISGL